MGLKFALAVFCLIAGLLAIVWAATHPTVKPPSIPAAPAVPKEVIPQSSEAELRAKRELFFKTKIEPSIEQADKLNREAADRCIVRLNQVFEGYRSGIKPFSAEINTWGTRFGVIRRWPGDWWHQRSEVENYIQEKFGNHLFTDKKVIEDINGTLTLFRADIEANQNFLATNVRVAISSSDLTGLQELDYSEFAKEVSNRLSKFSAQAAEDSLVTGIVIEVASGVGGVAAQQLLTQVIVRLAAMIGATTASAGGATAGGAAAGGGTGSLGGPVGAAAGFVVGLAIGGVVDWWISSSFEAKLNEQLNELISELNTEVIDGDVGRPGLRIGLLGSCDIILQTYKDTLNDRILKGGAL